MQNSFEKFQTTIQDILSRKIDGAHGLKFQHYERSSWKTEEIMSINNNKILTKQTIIIHRESLIYNTYWVKPEKFVINTKQHILTNKIAS